MVLIEIIIDILEAEILSALDNIDGENLQLITVLVEHFFNYLKISQKSNEESIEPLTYIILNNFRISFTNITSDEQFNEYHYCYINTVFITNKRFLNTVRIFIKNIFYLCYLKHKKNINNFI